MTGKRKSTQEPSPTRKLSPTIKVERISLEALDCGIAKRRKVSGIPVNSEPPGESMVVEEQSESATVAPAPNPPVTEKVAKKFTRHPVHWLPDGNTLVQIGETRFRLHRSTLTRHSNWFRQMIEDPPHDRCLYVDEQTCERVYCLDNLEVNVCDFIALLDALNNAITYVFQFPSFRTVASVLRAAGALEFSEFKGFAIDFLDYHWPSDVDNITNARLKYAKDTVALAQQYSVMPVLKRAYYELVRSEGFCQLTEDMEDGNDHEYTFGEAEYTLLVRAREKLTAFWMEKAIFPGGLLPKEVEHADARCTSARSKLYKKLVHRTQVFSKYKFDPICGLNVLISLPWGYDELWLDEDITERPEINERLCDACCEKLRHKWEEEKKSLWDNLDTWFGLNADEKGGDGSGRSN